jgi:hypothetical protein
MNNVTYFFHRTVKLQLKHLVNTRAPQNWSGTATNPSYNWPDITEFNWYGCQVMRLLLVMKRHLSWQEQRLNIRSQDLNQLAASQLELPRKWSGIARTEITKKYWESTTGLRTYTRALCQRNDLLKLNRDQLRWVVGLFTGHCHLKGHVFKLGLTDDPICERCLEDDESVTYPMWLWGHKLLKISSPEPVLHGTKWLLWRPINKILHFIRSVGLIKG